MRTTCAICFVILGLCVSGPTYAVKEQFDVNPQNAADAGFDVNATSGEDGVITVTVLRDPAKVRQPAPGTDIKIDQSATLRVFSDESFVVECILTPTHTERDGEDWLMYWFKIDRDYLKYLTLTIAELEDYSEWKGREQLIGGGTFFEFRLADFPVE